ncbi:MAG TPA: DUF2339 domain-containing protein, partial [Xanthomonadales bacterium]|nr:DUF2339 domain-containing protein [Xanthomonadales bacterium]
MYIGLTIAGLILGLFIAAGSDELFGALSGGGLGFLLAHVIKLGRKTEELKADLEWLRRHITTGTLPDKATVSQPEPEETAIVEPEETTAPAEAEPEEIPDFREFEASTPQPLPAKEKTPSFAAQVLSRVGNWFTSGNVPVKVGVVLSFIGVSFLLKFAIDNQLVSVPIEFRLLGVAAAAVVMIAVGWRLRHRLRTYGLSLQGGGVGILFLTMFAAFRIWNLMPAGLTFGLLVVLAALTGALAVLQKARWLIILGAVGGFAAPILTSTGQGSHVALFSYYLVLNATILGVSWFHAWRSVNLVGFFFTFIVGSMWGYNYYTPSLFTSTEPFLILFFLFYQAIAILYALRQPPGKIGLVDGTLVFGTPVIAFVLQSGLVRDFEYGMAISAAVLAVFYAVLATWLRRREGPYLKVLTESFIAL